METVACDFCSTNNTSTYLTLSDRFSGDEFQLVLCSSCGHIYLNPRPSPDELGDYYPASYEQHQVIDLNDQTLNRAEFQASKILIDFVEMHHSKRGKLLDVGCANGIFLQTAKIRGWDVNGVELIENAARIARERYGLNIHLGTIEDANFPPKSFDVITFWDVMEHLPSPTKAMIRCHELLKPGGIVIFTAPNLNSFDRYLFAKHWIGWEVPRHFHFLTPKLVSELLSITDFSFIDDRCITGGKGTFLLSLETWLNAHHRGSYSLRKFYPIISALLWPYRKVSYFLKRGPIITYVARKM